jgi:hypothetical protein
MSKKKIPQGKQYICFHKLKENVKGIISFKKLFSVKEKLILLMSNLPCFFQSFKKVTESD